VKRLVQFPLEDGSYILVEIDEPESEEGLRRIGRGEDILLKTEQTFETALERIKPIANTIINKLHQLNQPADEVEVKFGIKMSAEAGAIIASASVEGNYEITLKWKKD
jgi:hypothetical protein